MQEKGFDYHETYFNSRLKYTTDTDNYGAVLLYITSKSYPGSYTPRFAANQEQTNNKATYSTNPTKRK
jgi:hypothetical protein